MAKRGRRSTPAQLSSALRSVPPVPRPNLCLTPGTSPSTAPRAESPLRKPAGDTSAIGAEFGGFSFAVTPCENTRSPTLFKAPGPSRLAEDGPASTPVANPRAQPLPTFTPSSQPGNFSKRVGATEAARIARLQKFVDRVVLRSEEQELGEAGNDGAGPGGKEEEGEGEEAVTLTTIHQVRRELASVRTRLLRVHTWWSFVRTVLCDAVRGFVKQKRKKRGKRRGGEKRSLRKSLRPQVAI